MLITGPGNDTTAQPTQPRDAPDSESTDVAQQSPGNDSSPEDRTAPDDQRPPGSPTSRRLAHHNQQPEKTPVGKHQKAERCARTVTHSAKHYQFR